MSKNNIKLSIKAQKNVNRGGNKDFNLFKARILAYHDYTGSERELTALKEAVIEFCEADEELQVPRLTEIIESDFTVLYFSQNSKTGENVLNFNLCDAYTCMESYKGHCTLQKPTRDAEFSKTGEKQCCYALAIENNTKLKFVYGVCNYITMHQIDISEAVSQVREALEKFNCDYLRFNEFGCFYNEAIFVIADFIAGEVSDLAEAYSYTSNTDLFIKYYDKSYITLNLSNKVIKDLKDYKRTITVDPSPEAFVRFMEDQNYVICCGDCSNCSYCKDKEDFRVIVFFRHGNGVKLHLHYDKAPNDVEQSILNSKQYKKLCSDVSRENDAYLQRIGKLTDDGQLIKEIKEKYNL